MTPNLVSQFLNEHNYDIRVTRNGRWIDQKCAFDTVSFVADCVMNYLGNGGEEPFESPAIWREEYSIQNVMSLFGKPNPTKDSAKDEYNKFFRQPLKMFAAAGVMTECRKGSAIEFSVVNKDILSYIARRDRNSFDFICLYVEKTLKDSGMWDDFASFFDEQTKERYETLKDDFAQFCKKNTPINTSVEAGRIFNKVLNQLACKYHKRGTERGHMSKNIITFDKVVYNKVNWYDNLTSKDKNVARSDYTPGKVKSSANYQYQVNKAIKYMKKYYKEHKHNDPEVRDRYFSPGKCSAIHHIFPKSVFPQIAMKYENLIGLTSAQHMQEAHPNGNTQKINRDFQYQCLIVKADNIRQNIEGDGTPVIYDFDEFMNVLDIGLNTNMFSGMPDGDFDAVLSGIAMNYPTT